MPKEIFKIGVRGLSFSSGATTVSGVLANMLSEEIEAPVYFVSTADPMELGLSRVLKNRLSHKGVVYKPVDYINPEGIMVFDDPSFEKMAETDINVLVVGTAPSRMLPFIETYEKILRAYPNTIVLVNRFSFGASAKVVKKLLGSGLFFQNEIDTVDMHRALYEMFPVSELEGWDGVKNIAEKILKLYASHPEEE